MRIFNKNKPKKEPTHETAPEIHRPAGHPLAGGRIRLPSLLADQPLPHPTERNGKGHPRSPAHERLQRNDCTRQADAKRFAGTSRSDRLDRIRRRTGVHEDPYYPQRQVRRQHPHLHLGTQCKRHRPRPASCPASRHRLYPLRKQKLG